VMACVYSSENDSFTCRRFCRPVIDQNFYYAGLKFTGPTFACAMSNILPAMTFVLAVIFRWCTCTFQNPDQLNVNCKQPTN